MFLLAGPVVQNGLWHTEQPNLVLFGLFTCSIDASRIAQHGVRARCSLALHLGGLRDTISPTHSANLDLVVQPSIQNAKYAKLSDSHATGSARFSVAPPVRAAAVASNFA